MDAPIVLYLSLIHICLITGVYQPNAGTINIAGKYAMQLENDYLYDEKTGLENLKIFGKYFGFEINDRSDGYCTQLGLTEMCIRDRFR